MNERAKLVTFAVGNTDVSGQSLIPVFKLVSPDGTGGSRECIIFSKRLLKPPDSLALKAVASVHHIYQRATSDWLNLRESVLGGVNVYVGVGDRLETDPVLQGSYNYSETIDRGPDAHEVRDVKPHSDTKGFYVNPDNQFVPLASRKFRPNDNQGNPLADQVQVD